MQLPSILQYHHGSANIQNQQILKIVDNFTIDDASPIAKTSQPCPKKQNIKHITHIWFWFQLSPLPGILYGKSNQIIPFLVNKIKLEIFKANMSTLQ